MYIDVCIFHTQSPILGMYVGTEVCTYLLYIVEPTTDILITMSTSTLHTHRCKPATSVND